MSEWWPLIAVMSIPLALLAVGSAFYVGLVVGFAIRDLGL